MNGFCGMVDQWKPYFQLGPLSEILTTTNLWQVASRVHFRVLVLISGLVEWSCAVMITTIDCRLCWYMYFAYCGRAFQELMQRVNFFFMQNFNHNNWINYIHYIFFSTKVNIFFTFWCWHWWMNKHYPTWLMAENNHYTYTSFQGPLCCHSRHLEATEKQSFSSLREMSFLISNF